LSEAGIEIQFYLFVTASLFMAALQQQLPQTLARPQRARWTIIKEQREKTLTATG